MSLYFVIEEQGVLAWGSGEEGQLGVFGLEVGHAPSLNEQIHHE